MNSLLLRASLRSKGNPMQKFIISQSRSGHFHKPDPLPYQWYNYTRRTHLEDINTILYSDIAPEFHMHLHSL